MITKVVSKILGLMMVLFGLWTGLTVLAFASLIDPSLPEAEWWAECWTGMATRGGWGGLGFGLVVALVGAWLIVVPPGSDDVAHSGPFPKSPAKEID